MRFFPRLRFRSVVFWPPVPLAVCCVERVCDDTISPNGGDAGELLQRRSRRVEFSTETWIGDEATLDDNRGKVVCVLDFWATWLRSLRRVRFQRH